jgi:hypothetical protein
MASPPLLALARATASARRLFSHPIALRRGGSRGRTRISLAAALSLLPRSLSSCSPPRPRERPRCRFLHSPCASPRFRPSRLLSLSVAHNQARLRAGVHAARGGDELRHDRDVANDSEFRSWGAGSPAPHAVTGQSVGTLRSGGLLQS